MSLELQRANPILSLGIRELQELYDPHLAQGQSPHLVSQLKSSVSSFPGLRDNGVKVQSRIYKWEAY